MRHHPIVVGTGPDGETPPRDLADFLLRWGQFRPAMAALQDKPSLSKDEADVLGWMIALTDRLRADDVL